MRDLARSHSDDFWPAGIEIPDDALRLKFSRSSGPGGQNVNKLSTRAELWVSVDSIRGLTPAASERLKKMAGKRLTDAGEIHLAADVARTQESNRAAVMERLRHLLQQAIREPKRRRKTKPTRASRQRRIESKRRRGEIKTLRRNHKGDA